MRQTYHRIWIAAHLGWIMPRPFRRLLDRTTMQEAWLFGYTGCFERDGERFGPAAHIPAYPVSDEQAYGKRQLLERRQI